MTGVVAAPSVDPVHGSSAPNRYWTTANVGEAAPKVMTPLCWSLWGEGNEQAGLLCWHRFGLIGPDQIVVNPDQSERLTGIFYGRVALNVDVTRSGVDKFVGMSADDFEMGLTGNLHEGAPKLTALDEFQQSAVAESIERVRATHATRLAAAAIDQHDWWRRSVLHPTEYIEPVQRLRIAYNRWVRIMSIHVETRMLGVSAVSTVHRLAIASNAQDLVADATSAFGGVAEVAMAEELWRLAHGQVALAEFIDEYGHNGDAVGNPTGTSWREEPSLLNDLLATIKSRDSSDHPSSRASRAGDRQRAALSEMEDRLNDETKVRELRSAIDSLATTTRALEVGKAGFLRAVDGYRAAARDLGRELVAEGRVEEIDHAFMFTLEELERDRGASVDSDVLSARIKNNAQFRNYQLPATFRGFPEPLIVRPERPEVGEVLHGVGASGKSYEGTVRIVHGPDDYDKLESGDILVCETTDPSWTPMFLIVDAVVIDVGSAGSHGAIVARELGIPAVVNVAGASRKLQDGDRVVVDGSQGTVKVLALASGE
jgi:phosphohistidine swiveling domain-containing protein